MSAVTIQIETGQEGAALLARVQDRAGAMAAVAKAIKEENVITVSEIQRNYLSFPPQGPSQPLGLRNPTGVAKRSLRATEPRVTSDGVTTSIGGFAMSKGGGVNYLAVHELGATIPPHEISAAPGKRLRFQIGGVVFFRRKVKHPGAVLPARGMIQRGIKDRLTDYQEASRDALIGFLGGAK